jgi:hypothetical protein
MAAKNMAASLLQGGTTCCSISSDTVNNRPPTIAFELGGTATASDNSCHVFIFYSVKKKGKNYWVKKQQ